jgi:hypothetical protein
MMGKEGRKKMLCGATVGKAIHDIIEISCNADDFLPASLHFDSVTAPPVPSIQFKPLPRKLENGDSIPCPTLPQVV